MAQKRVLLLGGNFVPEPTGIGKYNGEMMTWLANQGYDCAVISTYPYYPHWKLQHPYEKKGFWYSTEIIETSDKPIKVYRCPHYIPQNPSGFKRIISDFSFLFSALVRIILLFFAKKYDIVIAVAPPFQLGLLGVFYKWIKGAKFVYHIQDLQIDAAKELKMIKWSFLLTFMFSLEKFILHWADYVSSISDGMMNKISDRCRKPVLFFPNWVDTETFFPVSSRESLKKKFGFTISKKVVLYSGAIGEKQGLESILLAAEQLIDHDIQFVICGSGPYKEKLHKRVGQMKLHNVHFMPLQPKEDFNNFLNMADLHLVLQKANATDLVMPSKLSTILAVGGLALVTASRKTSLHNIVSRHDMGLLVEPENQAALTDTILSAFKHSYDSIQLNARRFAKDYLTLDNVISKFMADIDANHSRKAPVPVTVSRKEKQEVVS
jgi:colanic acid biosynthesis glycosyl transferase WcaI